MQLNITQSLTRKSFKVQGMLKQVLGDVTLKVFFPCSLSLEPSEDKSDQPG